MGHSSINVSLTYLRGLEITELKEDDMPMVKKISINQMPTEFQIEIIK